MPPDNESELELMPKITAFMVLIVLTLALVACGGRTERGSGGEAGGTAAPAPAGAGEAGPKTIEIGMHADLATNVYYFDPIGVKINPGDTIRWTNVGNQPHNAQTESGKVPNGVEPFVGPMLVADGETYEMTFTEPGTYLYYCLPHRALGMYGVIVVGEPGGPGNTIPADVPVPSAADVAAQGTIGYEAFANK